MDSGADVLAMITAGIVIGAVLLSFWQVAGVDIGIETQNEQLVEESSTGASVSMLAALVAFGAFVALLLGA